MRGAVQIWHISLQVHSDKLLNGYYDCLSQDEEAKANRFRFPEDRRRFIVARGTLRHLLGRQFDQRPEAVTFCYGTYGKPSVGFINEAQKMTSASFASRSLASSQCDFHFNLSHSGEMAVCALGYDRKVGIDIEQIKPIKRLDSLMKRTLVSNEQTQVEAKCESAQSRAFLQRWTCKEAYLKAIGLGLTQSMQTIEVQLSPPELLRVPEGCEEGWQLHLLALPEDYVGALTVAGQVEVTTHQWPHNAIA